MATNTRLPKVTEYVKNVGKSVAFASIAAVKSQMPGVVDFADANDQIFKDIYGSVKDYKSTVRKMNTSVRNSNLYQAAELGVKNLVDDIKTGNLYNDRTNESIDSIMGFDESDMKFTYSVTDEDGHTSDRQLLGGLNAVMHSATAGTSTAVAKGTDMVIKSNKASAVFISSQIERSTATLHSGIGAVYDSVNRIGAFMSGPMTAHLENSRKYYDASLRIMQENQAMMREMLDMQRNLYKTQATIQNTSKLDQSFRYGGTMDIRGYSKNVKGNIENLMSMYGLDMLSKKSGMNVPMMIAATPLKILLDSFIGGMTKNKNIGTSLKNFDATFTSLFANVIARVNKKKSSSKDIDFSDIIRTIFGVEVGKKDKINTSNYNKGPVAFDGITRKTIVEVIPTYLARIEAALTGSGERFFDPHRGTWKSAKQVKTDFKAERDKSIQSANYDIRRDTSRMRSSLNKKDAADFDRALQIMMTTIYDDGGYFDPKLTRNGKKRVSSGDAYKKYGFKSKAQFDAVLSQLSDRTISGLAYNNMRAKQAYSNSLQQYELDGGLYNLLYNGAIDTDPYNKKGKKPASTSFAKNNLLAAARDEYGNNVFYYLREILNGVNSRWRNGRKKVNNKYNYSSNTSTSGRHSNRETHTASEESEGDSGSDDDSWDQAAYELDRDEEKRLRRQEKKNAISDWVSEKLDKTAVGRFLNKSFRGLGEVFAKPMQYASDLLDKANENLFQMMFGNTEMKDENGKKINNILEYMISKVKKSFDDLNNYIKGIFNPLWDKHGKPIWDKYGKPIWNEMKNYGSRARERAIIGLDNTLGKAFDNIEALAQNRVGDYNVAKDFASEASAATGDRMRAIQRQMYKRTMTKDQYKKYYSAIRKARRGNVSSADEVNGTASNADINDPGIIEQNAFGTRFVTKRGMTMISPGEVIIPASGDPNVLNRMLNAEKKDRSKILKSMRRSGGISLNAKGTVDNTKLRGTLYKIWSENKDDNKVAKIGAGGIIGGGIGLLTGINPLLGAVAGAGLSILDNSDTLKDVVFGKEINGERQGGLVSKKIQDIFKKYAPDMTDFGITGGVLGLLTPFGPLGGAAIGAGIGFLKNSEGFKKFIFGEDGTGEDGLISKEAYDKFIGFVKKSAPNMLIGAGAGILAGPFGLLGNAALGAGAGLIASTEGFHDFIFGNSEKGEAGLLDAFNTGFLQPAQEKLLDILADFKEYAKKNIFEPMKNFWKPVTQMLKNTIQDTTAKIGDHINDMFERTIGLPLHDFMQEKIFKPINKLIFGILKAPLAVGKAVVAAPFRVLGGIGNNIRAGQIRKGTAYDMTASERLAWRDEHKIRFNRFNAWRDKHRTQDELLANMSEADLQTLATSARAGLSSYSTLQRNFGNAKKDLGKAVSGFFNTKDATGHNRFNRVGYNIAKKIVSLAQNGDIEEAIIEVRYLNNLSDEEKDELIKIIRDGSSSIIDSADTLNKAKNVNGEVDKAVSKILGRKFKGRYDRRNIAKAAETELRAKRSIGPNAKTPLTEMGAFSEIYKEKTNTIISQFTAANKLLENLVHPNSTDTTPPGDKNNNEKTITNGDASVDQINKANKDIINQANAAIDDKKKKNKKRGIFGRITGGISNFLGLSSDDVDEDSKEAVEAKNKMVESEKKTDSNIEANQNTSSTLTKIKEFLMGKKEEKDGGILGWFKKGLGKAAKFFGIGALALTGVSFFGHASEWVKTSIWPKLSTFLFGTENEDGSKSGGFIGKLGDKINILLHGDDGNGGILGGLKTIAFGKDGNGGIIGSIKKLLFGDPNGKEGLLPRAANWITDKMTKVKEWLTSNGGIPGIIEKITPTFINGISLAINNIGAPLVSLAVKTFVAVIPGLVKALYNGLKMALPWGNKTLSRRVDIIDPKTLTSIDSTQDRMNSAIMSSSNNSSMWSGLVSSLKGVRDAAFNVDASIDMSSMDEDSSGSGNTQSNGLMGALGQTTRNNEVIYDEYGNPISDYTLKNTTDSILSASAKAGGRNFLRGLSGVSTIGTKIANGAAKNAAKGVANIITPGIGSTIKGTAQVAKAGVQTIGGGVGVAGNIGTAINSALTKEANYAGKYLSNSVDNVVSASNYTGKFVAQTTIKSVDNVAEAAVKKGILSGITNLFKEIAGSSIVKSIAKYATIMTSKTVTETVVKTAIEKIGTKLGQNMVGRLASTALTKLGSILAKFSPLTLAMFIVDFLYGFNNAYTILGVAKDGGYNINLAIKCTCGLVNMLTNFFTLGLLPTDVIMDIVIDILFPIFGVNADALNKARAEADDLLDEWNRQHPDQAYNNLEDYNNKEKWTTKVGNWFKNLFNGNARSSSTTSTTTIASTATSSSYGKGRTDTTLAGKGHIYQSGRDFANLPYGNSTIGEAGCAPVAAANLLNGLGRSGSIASVMDAAKYAEKHGMIAPNGGTDIGYFNSYLGSKGIQTTNTNNKGTVMNALRNGDQVIMLGRDGHNSPSAPFGSEPHYVTARGISRSGNIIAEDPDLPNGYVEYRPKDVMNSMISSVIANVRKKSNGKRRHLGRTRFAGKAYAMHADAGGSSTKLGAAGVLRVAKSQVNFYCSNNYDNKFIKAYYDQRVSTSSLKWNTIFVWWVFNQAGAHKIMSKTNSYFILRNFFKNLNRFNATPMIGDVIFMKKLGAEENICGIVISVGTKITVVFGGINNKSVNYRYISKDSRNIEGYGHPSYPYTYDSSSVVNMTKWGDKTNYRNIAFGKETSTTNTTINTGNNTTNNNNTSNETEEIVNSQAIQETLQQPTTVIENTETNEPEIIDNRPKSLIEALKKLGTSLIKKQFGNLYTAIYGDNPSEYKGNYEVKYDNNSTNTSTSTSNNGNTGYNYAPCSVAGEPYTTEDIWNALKAKGYSNAGIAGIMGNMNAESGYHANNLEDAKNNAFGMSDVEYTNAVNNKSYAESKFVNDQAGYGLVQNTWHTIKQRMYNNIVKKGLAIDSMNAQVNALASELNSNWPSLNNYLKTTQDVTEATDKFLKNYENPAAPEATRTFRRDSAWSAYNSYAGKGRVDYKAGSSTNALNTAKSYTTSRPAVYTNTNKTDYIDYAAFLKSIVEILITISSNTAMLSKILDILSDRFDLDKSEIEKIKTGNRDQITNVVNRLGNAALNDSGKAKLVNRKDTEYLLNALTAIASE